MRDDKGKDFMFYLIGEKEVHYILDGRTIEEITHRAITTYRSRPGFFAPYKSGYEKSQDKKT